MHKKLHPSALLTWAVANSEALKSSASRILPVHLFAACLSVMDHLYDPGVLESTADPGFDGLEQVSVQCRTLLGLNEDQRLLLRRRVRTSYLQLDGVYADRLLHRSRETRAVFERAGELAGPQPVSLLHLLQTLLQQLPEPAVRAYAALDLPLVAPDLIRENTEVDARSAFLPAPGMAIPLLDRFGRDLTRLAREGYLPPVCGRDQETKTLARALLRTTKRNVLLVGKAGVGKTALVEGLAQRLVAGDLPEQLAALRLIEVSLPGLVAGTRYRGDLEERVSQLVAEAERAQDVVLFLDELHLAVGSAGGGGGMDVASMLLPALARGGLRCIGATTPDAYDRTLRGSTAFLRRFQVIQVAEPSPAETAVICRVWAERLEAAHQVVVADEAVEAAVSLAVQHLPQRNLPDKAIDLLENAATYAQVSTLTARARAPRKHPIQVTRTHVEQVLEEQYGVTLSRPRTLDLQRFQAVLESQLVGQSQASEELLAALQGVQHRWGKTRQPLGVVLLVGPTGVGKTRTAELLAQVLPGAGEGDVPGRFHMNEYKERHDVARIIGAPPGFIGHENQGALFRFVDEHPQGVILLDEVEKAHPEVLDFFLQVFDRGEARDPTGREVSFQHYLFVLTSNLAAAGEQAIGFVEEPGRMQDADRFLRTQMENVFRREFLARMDAVIAFRSLTGADFGELFKRTMGSLQDQVQEDYGVSLIVDDQVGKALAQRALGMKEGARGFLRLFNQLVMPQVIEAVSRERNGRIHLGWQGDGVVLEMQNGVHD